MSLDNQIGEIKNSLKAFVLKMLQLCESWEEIETFFNKDDNLCGLSLKGTMLLPRINQAMQLHFKEFVNHDYCQQVMRDTFYHNTPLKNRGDEDVVLIGRVIIQILKTPFVCLLHSLAKVADFANCCKCHSEAASVDEEDGLPLGNIG